MPGVALSGGRGPRWPWSGRDGGCSTLCSPSRRTAMTCPADARRRTPRARERTAAHRALGIRGRGHQDHRVRLGPAATRSWQRLLPTTLAPGKGPARVCTTRPRSSPSRPCRSRRAPRPRGRRPSPIRRHCHHDAADRPLPKPAGSSTAPTNHPSHVVTHRDASQPFDEPHGRTNLREVDVRVIRCAAGGGDHFCSSWSHRECHRMGAGYCCAAGCRSE